MIFEDSPTCLNYGHPEHLRPCSECVLLELVPEAHRNQKVPCRHIPLTEDQETLQSLYATENLEEIEVQLADWLMSTIQKLELERARNQASNGQRSWKDSVGSA